MKIIQANIPTWEDVYFDIEERVTVFFLDNPQDNVLKINISDEESWDNICALQICIFLTLHFYIETNLRQETVKETIVFRDLIAIL